MAKDENIFLFLVLFIIYALYTAQNKEPSNKHVTSEESPSQPPFTMLSDDSIESALGTWKTIYVNARWTTETCEEIAFKRTTESDKYKFKHVYENVEWDKVKLNFIQEGDVIAVLLQKDIPGVYASVPVNGEVEIAEEEFSSFQYVLLGDFMVVNDLNVDDAGYVLVLSRNLAELREVKQSLDVIGVDVSNVTGCVVEHDHDEL